VFDPRDDADRGFGLLGDSDHLWSKDKRERQKHQVGAGVKGRERHKHQAGMSGEVRGGGRAGHKPAYVCRADMQPALHLS